MADSNQEKQDQSIDDSTAMTIEFLRARLLSERSVSKSARQRADELEKRVAELEEELRIISLQRKMAEKATADVLSILESRGISENSEAFDSGSDHETNQESNEGNDFQNGEEHSVVSKRSELEELSGSDLDSSPANMRSLSWKGRNNDSSRSREKFRDPSIRRRISSIGSSSPKHHLGKSCRQIRRREARVVIEEGKNGSVKIDSQGNGVHTPPEDVPECSDSTPEILRGVSESVAGERSIANHIDANGHVQEQDMEKALEDQAKLIGKYEAMEKAQREWEEKFRENNNGTPDSYDPGNHSDVTEERDDVKAQTPFNTGTDITEPDEAKPRGEVEVDTPKELPKSQSNGFLSPSHVNSEERNDHTSSIAKAVVAPRFQAPEFAFPTAKEAHERRDNNTIQPVESFHSDVRSHSTHLGRPSSETGSSSHKGEPSGSQNDRYALVPHDPSSSLSGVLDALKLAKLQLQSKMSKMPPDILSGSIHTPAQPSHLSARITERSEIPAGSAGLFRLPTDFTVEEADTRAEFLSYRSNSSLAPYYSDNRVAVAPSARFSSSPYIERRPGFPQDDHFLTSSSMGSGSRASLSLNSRSDPYFDTGPSSVNRYNNYSPHHPYAPSPDLMPQMPRTPSNEGFPRAFPSRGEFGSPADRLSFYNDHGRPNNMYR